MPCLVHLDANAGASVHPAAWAAWMAAAAHPSPPHALHAEGRAARARLRTAQTQIAAAIGAEADAVLLVSGGTEADAWALSSVLAPLGPRRAPGAPLPEVVTTGVEHAAVTKTLEAWAEAGLVRPVIVAAARTGRVEPAAIAAAITPQTALVSMTWACNETGVLQPVAEVARLAQARGVPVHTDAVQAVGRMPVDVVQSGVDYLSLSGHKLGAVGGMGALYAKPGTPALALYPDHTVHNVAGAASLAAALAHMQDAAHWAGTAEQRNAFEAWAVRQFADQIEILGGAVPRLPNTSCMRFVGCSAEAMMMALDVAHIAIATGSACSTGAVEPSPLLMGMGLGAQAASEAVRLSFAGPIDDAAMQRLRQALVRAQGALAGRRF